MLPKDKFIRTTAEYTSSELAIHYYPADEFSEFTLFDDDGASKNSITAKKYELITLKANLQMMA
jgi:hypothetical protein